MSGSTSWLLSVFLMLVGCIGAPTEILVVIGSDFRPGDQLARVVVRTHDEAGATVSEEEFAVGTTAGETTVTLPWSFGVRPGAGPGRPLRLEVQGFAPAASEPFVVRRVTVPFVIGERRRIVIFLERVCERVTCASSEETCSGGVCVDAALPFSALEPVPEDELQIDPPLPAPGHVPTCTDDPGCDEATNVEVGHGFGCVRRYSGRVACWGEEAALGQLGSGTTAPSPVPLTVLGVDFATGIVAGGDFACVSSEETPVRCWGGNTHGQLAQATESSSAMPLTIDGAHGVRLFGASRTGCASTGGDVTCWGAALNIPGEVAPDRCGETACARTPVVQPPLYVLESLADEGHTCLVLGEDAARPQAQAFCIGGNSFGEVGDGTREARTAPTRVEGLGSSLSVTTTDRGACAIEVAFDEATEVTTNTARCWGADDLGQLGGRGRAPDVCGAVPCSLSPSTVDGVVMPLELTGSGDTICARELGGRVLCWGSDADGGLGDGVGAPERCGDVPCARAATLAHGLVDAVDLDGRAGTFCAVRRTGSVVCWGRGYADLPLEVGPLPD